MGNLNGVQNLLKQFAFTDSESAIYLAVLSLGKSKVSDIAKKANLNRTAAYACLDNLIARGLISKIKVLKTLHFVATPPKELAENFQKITDEFKTAVPELESLNKIEVERPMVEITESQLGYYKVYDAISNLSKGEVFRVIEGKESFLYELDLLQEEQLKSFLGKLVEKGIETHGIFTKESLGVPNIKMSDKNLDLIQQRVWDLRTLPEEILPLQDLALIYGNRISFLFPKMALVLTIRHQGLVDILISMFDCIFHFADKVKDPWK